MFGYETCERLARDYGSEGQEVLREIHELQPGPIPILSTKESGQSVNREFTWFLAMKFG